jgi:hypothetical protein
MYYQTIFAGILGGLLSLVGSYFALRWQYKRTISFQRKSTQEKTYVKLFGLRISLRQAFVSRYEALIFSDYHEYKWKYYGANNLDREEAQRWMQKSENYVEKITDLLRDIFECIADIHISYKTTTEIIDLTERIYNYKTPAIKSPIKGEVEVRTPADLERWKETAVSQIQNLVEREYAELLHSLLNELRKQLSRNKR